MTSCYRWAKQGRGLGARGDSGDQVQEERYPADDGEAWPHLPYSTTEGKLPWLVVTWLSCRAGGSSYRLVRPILYNTAKNNHCAFTLAIIVVFKSYRTEIRITMREHQRNKPKCLRRLSLAVVLKCGRERRARGEKGRPCMGHDLRRHGGYRWWRRRRWRLMTSTWQSHSCHRTEKKIAGNKIWP